MRLAGGAVRDRVQHARDSSVGPLLGQARERPVEQQDRQPVHGGHPTVSAPGRRPGDITPAFNRPSSVTPSTWYAAAVR